MCSFSADLGDARGDHRLGYAAFHQREADVVARGHVRKEREVLEHHRDIAGRGRTRG